MRVVHEHGGAQNACRTREGKSASASEIEDAPQHPARSFRGMFKSSMKVSMRRLPGGPNLFLIRFSILLSMISCVLPDEVIADMLIVRDVHVDSSKPLIADCTHTVLP